LPNTFEFPKIPSADEIEKMKPVQRRNLVASLLQNIPVVSFLDTIGYAEGADYNSLFGDHPAHKIPKWKFSDYSKHPGGVGSGGSSVSGRYQFKDETYALYAPKLGISDFSPRSQDMLAVYLLLSKGEFPKLANGDFKGVVNKRSKTWASFPTANGISYYLSQPAKPIEKLESFYTARRSFHKNNFLLSQKKKMESAAPTYPSGFLDGRTLPYPVIIPSL
jgi:muramidase (phage lysozyme)